MGERARNKRMERERREAIERAKTIEGMSAERETYANAWPKHDAAKFAGDGHYKWMASQIGGFNQGLEIGKGDGSGTIELLRNGHAIVSIDENPACLRIADEQLNKAGFAVTTTLRGTVHQGADGYTVTYGSLTLSRPTTGALLVEGDTLNDPQLQAWLRSLGPFDAVTCWLM